MSRAKYTALAAECTPYAWGGTHIKILETPNGTLIKLFRLRTLISSGLIYPYSLRFVRNAVRLRRLSIPSIEFMQTFYVPRDRLHCTIYKPLPGIPLIEQTPSIDLIDRFAHFVADLHHRGIYFRSLHLGNVLTLPEGGFGLIDLVGMHFRGRPLRPSERARNFNHLLRREDNRAWYGKPGAMDLVHAYEKAQADFGERRVKLTPKLLALVDKAWSACP